VLLVLVLLELLEDVDPDVDPDVDVVEPDAGFEEPLSDGVEEGLASPLSFPEPPDGAAPLPARLSVR